MNKQNTNTTIEQRRSIPMDLFPVYDKKLTNEWARNTYEWRYLFDDECKSLRARTDEDIVSWLIKAKEIREELQNIGISHGQKQVLYLANTIFNLKMCGTNSISPTKIMDVVSIYANRDFYVKYKDKNIQELYQITYGLTRNGGNNWILDAEAEWMNTRQIKYKSESGTQVIVNRTRGCIYQNISTKFANTNIRRFRKMLQRQHGEVMFVRDKLRNNNNVKNLKKIRCCAGYVYLGECQSVMRKHFVQENDCELQAKQWVKQCVNNGYSVSEIQEIVQEWTQNDDDDINDENSLENKLGK